MNKRRDALRRGIRSLIQDTSRELAGLAEPPPPWRDGTLSPDPTPAKVAPASEEATASDGEAGFAPAPGGSLPPGPNLAGPAAHADAPAVPAAPSSPAGSAAPVGAPAESAPAPVLPAIPRPAPAAPPQGAPRPWADALRSGHPPLALPPRDIPGPKPSAPRQAHFREIMPSLAASRARPQKAGRKKAARGKAAVPPAASRPAHRLRRRQSEDLILDGVNPRQAHARKGVCFAYFINKRCWRVPQAYCNAALHVCAIRECPVYHLHKDALERRFTEKYKHFW